MAQKNTQVDLPILILQQANDRRVFDLFFWLRKRLPEVTFALLGNPHPSWSALIFTGALQLPFTDMASLVRHVAAHPDKQWVYLPLVEEDILALLQMELPANFKAILPNLAEFELVRNKKDLSVRFQAEGHTPRTFTPAELKINFPAAGVVVKPAIGKGAIGRRFVENYAQLGEVEANDVIQERVGVGKEVVGAFYLMKDGVEVAHYQHHRIRTFPESGGVSSCAETIYIPEIHETGRQMLADLKWNGLAMLEFLQEPTSGKYKVIECNPRLWGTSLLGEYAGYALVEKYVRLCLNLPLPAYKIREKARIRWYFPYEILYALKSPLRQGYLLWPVQKDYCYINATAAGWWRPILYVAFGIFDPHKWSTLFKKISGRR